MMSKQQGWYKDDTSKRTDKHNQEIDEWIAKRRKISSFSGELEVADYIPEKKAIISCIYDVKDPKSWYWVDFGHWLQDWKDEGWMDPNGNIHDLNFLQGLQKMSQSLYIHDVWGLRTRAKIARIHSDVTHFIQLMTDKEMKSDTLQMVPIMKDHRQTVLNMLEYMRDMFLENIEATESVDWVKNIFYPVKRAKEMPDYKIACKFLLEPLLSFIRKKLHTIERRYINLLTYDSNSAQNVERRSSVASSLIKIQCEYRLLGKEIAHEHDCFMLMAEEQNEKMYQQQDVHDLAYEFYIAIMKKEQELNTLGDQINTMTERETEFNLLMDADKIKEAFYLASDEKYDFQMNPVEKIRELHDKVLDMGLCIRKRESEEFMEYVYALDIVSKGGMDVYRHPLLEREEKNKK